MAYGNWNGGLRKEKRKTMKKTVTVLLALTLIFTLAACGQSGTATGSAKDTPADNESTSEPAAGEPVQAMTDKENPTENEGLEDTGKQTPITLTIGDTVLSAYLNDSAPAQSLIAQLPLTVTLNDSDNDFCGDSLDIEYADSDVTSGYKNGDLAFWTPASNFVIFVSGEENSADTGNLVILGRVTEPQEALDALNGTIDVRLALADEDEQQNGTENVESQKEESAENNTASNETEVSEVKIKITVGETELIATMEDNATTQAIIEQMPMTLPMMDLYGREMCYRYGAYALPTDNLRSDGYEVGDIAYWAPGGSLVILYAQNGEEFERQHLGHIDSGVEVFANTGDVDVTFEMVVD